jgi:hypothetical protein
MIPQQAAAGVTEPCVAPRSIQHEQALQQVPMMACPAASVQPMASQATVVAIRPPATVPQSPPVVVAQPVAPLEAPIVSQPQPELLEVTVISAEQDNCRSRKLWAMYCGGWLCAFFAPIVPLLAWPVVFFTYMCRPASVRSQYQKSRRPALCAGVTCLMMLVVAASLAIVAVASPGFRHELSRAAHHGKHWRGHAIGKFGHSIKGLFRKHHHHHDDDEDDDFDDSDYDNNDWSEGKHHHHDDDDEKNTFDDNDYDNNDWSKDETRDHDDDDDQDDFNDSDHDSNDQSEDVQTSAREVLNLRGASEAPVVV